MALPTECRLCAAPIEKQFVATPHVYGGQPGQAFFRCEACGVFYQYPPIAPAEEQHFYAMEFEKFMAGRGGVASGWHHPQEHVSANKEQVARRMRYLTKLFPTGRALRICEIGCSSGFMLYPLREAGHQVFGVEPSGVFGEYLRERGIAFVSNSDEFVTNGRQVARFDVVMHFFVLEHIRDPLGFLKANLDLVTDGGMVIIEVPNAADPLVSIYDIPAFERFYWSVAHHWYFTESSLEYVLRSTGYRFQILRDQRYDLSNHLTWALNGLPGGQGHYSALLGQELDHKYRELLVERGHCDTLVGVIRKNRLDE